MNSLLPTHPIDPITGAVRAAILADPPLAALLAGGVHPLRMGGRVGISRAALPDAYDADGFLLPCALVRIASADDPDMTADAFAITDGGRGARVIVDLHLFTDGDDGGALDLACAQLRVLLARRWLPGVGWVSWQGDRPSERDPRLGDAASASVRLLVRTRGLRR